MEWIFFILDVLLGIISTILSLLIVLFIAYFVLIIFWKEFELSIFYIIAGILIAIVWSWAL